MVLMGSELYWVNVFLMMGILLNFVEKNEYKRSISSESVWFKKC